MVSIKEQVEQSENSDDELTVVPVEEKPRRPPHNYVSIVNDAFHPFDASSPEKICQQLYRGILLREKKQKYWVDKESNKNCFMVLARDLAIAWSGDSKYWGWTNYKESDDEEEEIEVAVLRGVCWLEICGKFRTIGLAPGTVYEAAFVVMMLETYYGWNCPVKLSVTPPNGEMKEHVVYLCRYPKKKWVEIPIWEFTMSPENVGEVAFWMNEHGAEWKSGMAVKGVSFRPKKGDSSTS